MVPNDATAMEAQPTIVESKESLEFLSEIRDELKGNFSLNAGNNDEELNSDVEHNICCIRALLAVNDAILSRCMAHVVNTGNQTKLTRFGFETIKTRQKGSTLEFIVQAERVIKTFDTLPLATPPSGFDNIIVVKYKPHSMLIDFTDIFHKTLLLNDDVLNLLLPKLKVHLEEVQVCLGKLDEWAMQPIKNVSFINSVFQKEYELPQISNLQSTVECCNCQSSLAPAVDTNAFGTPVRFRPPTHQLPSQFRQDPVPESTYWYNNTCKRACVPAPESTCWYNTCKRVCVITSGTVSGEHQVSFNIKRASERAKLLRFVYYVTGDLVGTLPLD